MTTVKVICTSGVDFAVGEFAACCICGDLFGACCDPFTGVCTDNVDILDCVPLQFFLDEVCAELDPMCGNPGCCCEIPEEGAPQVPIVAFEANCDGRFLPGVMGDECVGTAFDPECGFYIPCVEQLPNQVTGIFSDLGCDACPSGVQVLAENFVLVQETPIQSVTFWGGFYPGDTPVDPDCWTIVIRDDDAGLPGAAIEGLTWDCVGSVKEQTGVTLFGVNEWMVTVDLGVTVAAGTYHIEIYTDSGTGSDDWFWEAGNLDAELGIAGQAFSFSVPEDWNYDPAVDMAFLLTCGGS